MDFSAIVSLLAEVWGYVKGIADLDTAAKIGAVVMALIAIWKSSVLAHYWEKLGSWKVLIAPVLGLGLAVTQLPWSDGGSFFAVVWAGIKSGALAMGFRALIDALKNAPFIGDKYKSWLAFFDKILFKDEAAVAAAKAENKK